MTRATLYANGIRRIHKIQRQVISKKEAAEAVQAVSAKASAARENVRATAVRARENVAARIKQAEETVVDLATDPLAQKFEFGGLLIIGGLAFLAWQSGIFGKAGKAAKGAGKVFVEERRNIKKTVRTAAPIAGAAIGGPPGAAIGALAGQAAT